MYISVLDFFFPLVSLKKSVTQVFFCVYLATGVFSAVQSLEQVHLGCKFCSDFCSNLQLMRAQTREQTSEEKIQTNKPKKKKPN